MKDELKSIWWNHYVQSEYKLPRFTKTRLEKVKPIVWGEEKFWNDINRHRTTIDYPHELKKIFFHNYEKCMSNMGAMIREIMTKNKILK